MAPSENKKGITPSGAKEDAGKEKPPETPPTEESLGLSPYEHFKTLGRKIGVNDQLVEVITDHISNGGNYKDIKWVYRGLSEMAIRDDIGSRWGAVWGRYLQKSLPLEKSGQRKSRWVKDRRS